MKIILSKDGIDRQITEVYVNGTLVFNIGRTKIQVKIYCTRSWVWENWTCRYSISVNNTPYPYVACGGTGKVAGGSNATVWLRYGLSSSDYVEVSATKTISTWGSAYLENTYYADWVCTWERIKMES